MKYADINERYTEIVAEYVGKGYTINTASMGGSQGETCKIDLTNGTEIIRILFDTFSDYETCLGGVEIIVGKCTDKDVHPHEAHRFGIIWNDNLEILSVERFYKVGESDRHGSFFCNEVEAKAAANTRRERYLHRKPTTEYVDITDKAMEIAKRAIRRKLGVKRVRSSDIQVFKAPGIYSISYKNKSFRLH